MFIVYEDMTVSLNRGDVGVIPVPQSKDGDYGYSISAGDILRIRVFRKNKCKEVALVKDFLVETATSVIELELDGTDTKIGDIINKPTTYWYEIELNPDTHPQTIVGYNEDGPKIFMIYPEGDDSGELPSINTGKPVTVSDEAVESIVNNEIFQEVLKKVTTVIEQHYNSKSQNAQSGTAVAEAVKELYDTVSKWMTDMKNNVVVPGDNEVKEYVDEEIKKVVFGNDSDVTDEKLAELIAQYIENNPVVTIDKSLSETSTNPVQNKVIYAALTNLINDVERTFASFKDGLYSEINEIAANFVTKEEGKGLSSNDFTDEYKAKLDNIDDTLEDVIANIDGIPSYWQEALDNGANAIRQAMESAGRNKSAFLFYSDAHWDYGSQMSPKLLKYLYNHTAITKTFFGGDVVNSESTDRESMEYLYEWREMLKGLPNHHSVVGNHDDGNGDNDKMFPEEYIYAYLLAPEETPNMVLGDGMYYYIDEPCEKTRYLFLDTAYKGVDDTQTAFITEALKSTQSGWHIVVVSHIWYMPDYNQYNVRPVPLTGLSSDASTVTTMLDNYNSRVGAFADCEGWVEFCIGGHIHYDYDSTTATGIPIILVETDSQHTRGNYSYTAGTTTESSVNGIIADYDNHTISIVRIGRGESKKITVTNYQITYTNVLPLATEADGVTPYNNGKGYKENTRWSTSGSAEVDATGIYLTGYIPAKEFDVISLKNITMPKNGENNECTIHFFYDNNLTVNGANHNATNLITYNSAVWDENENLIQVTMAKDSVSQGTTLTHIRIQGTYIDVNSIITVNEVIE